MENFVGITNPAFPWPTLRLIYINIWEEVFQKQPRAIVYTEFSPSFSPGAVQRSIFICTVFHILWKICDHNVISQFQVQGTYFKGYLNFCRVKIMKYSAFPAWIVPYLIHFELKEIQVNLQVSISLKVSHKFNFLCPYLKFSNWNFLHCVNWPLTNENIWLGQQGGRRSPVKHISDPTLHTLPYAFIIAQN